ncbi:hypothetical protein L596_010829 [Steinernema carpocapsae]|uniref:Granulins domain-containing protein n=1 Tax=Steinernema carpocapsae TaxID=34508 RepID=A0A4U5PJQ4_STECR|nr:hypothetical protein L596_010829 [Steinernema carpocapsae]
MFTGYMPSEHVLSQKRHYILESIMNGIASRFMSHAVFAKRAFITEHYVSACFRAYQATAGLKPIKALLQTSPHQFRLPLFSSSSSTMKFFTVALLAFAAVLALTSAQGCSGGTQCTGGCCPDANAVCCPSGNACCPHATKCDEAQGLCIPVRFSPF